MKYIYREKKRDTDYRKGISEEIEAASLRAAQTKATKRRFFADSVLILEENGHIISIKEGRNWTNL